MIGNLVKYKQAKKLSE